MSEEILNTPGYYYSFAYWLSAFIISLTHRGKGNLVKRILTDTILFIVLYLFMHFTDGIVKWLFIPSMLTVTLMLFCYIRVSCGFNFMQTGYLTAKTFINGEFAASLCWQIYYNYSGDISAVALPFWRWAEMIIAYIVIFIGVYLIERYLSVNIEEIKITVRELVIVFVITIIVFTVSNMSYLNQEWLFSSTFAKDIFTIRTLVDACGVILLYAYQIEVRAVQTRFEMEMLQNVIQTQYSNYQLSKESIDMVNQKYHDLKHQIALLKEEANTRKAVSYLEKMESDIRQYEAQNKTGNEVLDTVLTGKAAYCQSEGIELKCVAEGKLLDIMDDMDICSLFGNMLDNAIEAVVNITEKEKRLIRLYVIKEKGFLRICTENYCESELKFKNGMPLTNKKDKRIHGYGMKSISQTVGKYGGSAVASLDDKWFKLKILIPLPAERK